jgi:hypothetical protein
MSQRAGAVAWVLADRTPVTMCKSMTKGMTAISRGNCLARNTRLVRKSWVLTAYSAARAINTDMASELREQHRRTDPAGPSRSLHARSDKLLDGMVALSGQSKTRTRPHTKGATDYVWLISDDVNLKLAGPIVAFT